MSRWRSRVGAQHLELLSSETVDPAVRDKHLPARDLKQTTSDTTVQEKNVTYPSQPVGTRCMTIRHTISGYCRTADRPNPQSRNQSQGLFMDD